MLSHAPRQFPSWLIFDVRQKMNPRFFSALVMLLLSACATAPGDYTLQKAANAAGEVLSGRTDFMLFNLPEPKADPFHFLEHLHQARRAKVPLAVGAPRLEYIRDVLTSSLEIVGDQRFDGLTLVIVGPRRDDAMFAPFRERGITIVCTVYK